MKFDKSRVYTALNAEELPIGSKCIFADSVKELKEGIRKNRFDTLLGIADEQYALRFISGHDHGNKNQFALAHLVELPAEPQYKPFSGIKKAKEEFDKHGGWVKYKDSTALYYLIAGYNATTSSVYLGGNLFTFEQLFNLFVFLDDNTPCGELVEEE